jgi:hypothetical protein
VNKKKQKNFKRQAMGVGADNAHGPMSKSFLLLFFKKEALSYLKPPGRTPL